MLDRLLSPFYQKWLPRDVRALDVSEPFVDCDNCRMTPERRGPRAQQTYQEHLKCCTFEPFLPNFHVGALLEDPVYEKRISDVIRAKWAAKDVILPLGLVASIDYQREFGARERADFGNREDLLCPYFDRAKLRCGIWLYRGAVCTSFYCTSQYGPAGKRFWKSLGEYLSIVDMFAAEEIIADMGFSPRQISDQLAWLKIEDQEQKKLKNAAKEIEALWPPDLRDPFTFYRECYRMALTLTPERMQESMGELGAKKLAQLRKGKKLDDTPRTN